MSAREPVGSFCLVLHTHLPWVAHHGAWPVGEEWLHQAWATSYQPMFRLLRDLAAEGRRGVLSLGVTPVLAAQWDDPYCLRQQSTWLGMWQARAAGMAGARELERRAVGAREFRAASHEWADFEAHWRHGGSAALRPLVDAGVIEVLGGPLTHSFTPLLPDFLARNVLEGGLDDGMLRIGHRAAGIWTPECAYAPGLEEVYRAAGVRRLVLDGPTLLGAGASTADAWTLGDSDVAVVGRDLDVSYRVWSPRRGYPGDPWYRDFHTFDHEWGFRPARVTGRTISPEDKKPYDPERAAGIARRDADDFIGLVRERLVHLRHERDGRPGLVVAAYDTELFGHWWHEGPTWLGHVLRGLPEAGVRLVTLGEATAEPAGRCDAGPGSWGSGKDWRVWQGEAVEPIVKRQHELTQHVLTTLARTHPRDSRSPEHDQLVRGLLLALASDWAFMVSKDSAADYARHRFADHADAAQRLSDALRQGRADVVHRLAEQGRAVDGPFGQLDARRFIPPLA